MLDDEWKELFSQVGVTAEQMQRKEKATEPRKQLIFLFFLS